MWLIFAVVSYFLVVCGLLFFVCSNFKARGHHFLERKYCKYHLLEDIVYCWMLPFKFSTLIVLIVMTCFPSLFIFWKRFSFEIKKCTTTIHFLLQDGFHGRKSTKLRSKPCLRFLMANLRSGHRRYTRGLEILSWWNFMPILSCSWSPKIWLSCQLGRSMLDRKCLISWIDHSVLKHNHFLTYLCSPNIGEYIPAVSCKEGPMRALWYLTTMK